MNRSQLVVAALVAADRCLKPRGYIAFDEVFLEMGKLDAKQWEEWRHGRVPYLERLIGLSLSQINAVCRALQESARRGKLKPSWTGYLKWGKGPQTPLRFTRSGDPHLERVWATRHVRVKPKATAVNPTGSPVADARREDQRDSVLEPDKGITPGPSAGNDALPSMS